MENLLSVSPTRPAAAQEGVGRLADYSDQERLAGKKWEISRAEGFFCSIYLVSVCFRAGLKYFLRMRDEVLSASVAKARYYSEILKRGLIYFFFSAEIEKRLCLVVISVARKWKKGSLCE